MVTPSHIKRTPMRATLLVYALAALFMPMISFAEGEAPKEMTKEEQAAAIKKFEESLVWKKGEVPLKGGLVKLNLPADFKYLDSANAARVLRAWGNTNVGETEGMLFPAALTPFSDNSW